VPGILELAQLVEYHGVAEMDVWGGGIDAQLHAQLAALALGERELLFEGAVGKDVDGAHTQIVDESLVCHEHVSERCGMRPHIHGGLGRPWRMIPEGDPGGR